MKTLHFKAYKKLLEWKNKRDKRCLMVLGARQVGKTFLIREFGRKEYESFIEINFIKDPDLKDIFAGSLNADELLKRITANVNGVSLIPGKTLLFLDEIQVSGNARTALKFFAEEKTIDVIASGSLLGLSYGEDGDPEVEIPSSIPTGYEEFMSLYPLDFEEFVIASGVRGNQLDVLKEAYEKKEQLPRSILEKYEMLFREYMVIGGMPEVVDNFARYHDFTRVQEIQERIQADYQFDIAKHAKGVEKVKVRRCYDSLPMQLAKERRKFQYSKVEKGQTSKKYGDSIKWLVDSSMVNPCYAVAEPNLPLFGNADEAKFKLYFHDTGLLMSLYGFETKRALLNNTLTGNVKGGLYENVFAQILVAKGHRLYFYRPNDTQEIEFLIEDDAAVVPVEVKSGNSRATSLNVYVEEKHPRIAYKFIDGGIGEAKGFLTLPHFMVLFL